MKFVCDRCLTKYSIPDEKVRGKVLKVRCKNCSNVVTVKEAAPVPQSAAVAEAESDRTVISSRPNAAPAASTSSYSSAPPRPARPTPAPSPSLARAESSRAAPAIARMPAPARAPTPPPPAADDGVQWFLALDGVQKGPLTRKVLIDRLVALPRNADVHVWSEDLDAWKPPRQVPSLAQELLARQRPPVPPPPPAPRARTIPPSAGLHAPPSPSGLPIGTPPSHAAHASAASAAPDLAIDMVTPPPQRAPNGHSGPASASAVAPASLLPGSESDALNVLNLGTPARAANAALSSSGAVPIPSVSAPMGTAAHVAVMHAEVRSKGPRLALAAVFLVFVGVCVAVLNFVLVKKPEPAPTAQKPEPPKSAPAGQPEPPLKESPAAAILAGRGPKADKAEKESPSEVKDDGKDGKEPSSVVVAGRADPGGKGGGKKQNHGRPAPHGQQGTSLEPAPFSPSATSSPPPDTSVTGRIGERRVVPIRGGGATSGRSGPDQSEISRVINNNKSGIKVCYQRALTRDSTLTHGKIQVEISIGLSGRVKKVSVDGPASFRVMDPCIRDVINRWVFPASSDEYGTEFSYSFQGNE